MSKVKVICEETRYVARDRYITGGTYEMDAARAGKYAQSFRPVTDSDRVEAEAAWLTCLEESQAETELRRELANVDPSLVKAAIIAVQEQIGQAVQARAARAKVPA